MHSRNVVAILKVGEIEMKDMSRIVALFIIAALLFTLFGTSCTPCQDFDSCLNSIVKPYRFSIATWEYETFVGKRQNSVVVGAAASKLVVEYFSLVKRIYTLETEIAATESSDRVGNLDSLEAELSILVEQQTNLAHEVSRIMATQIEDTLAREGIFNPWQRFLGEQFRFPPVNFRMEPLPYLLVISPRYRIESMRELILHPDTSAVEIEEIETAVDELDVSSLVVELGGFGGTYPAIVSNRASLQFTINAAIEEWLHQYLIFKPLGYRYLLDLAGISRDYEIATINETLASMVSKEIGTIIYEKFYSEYESDNNRNWVAEFDFNREMREIRRQVDGYLADGEVEQVEMFMEQKRQYLVSKGYYIRKLNQAYFAFYGTYADGPTSINPIGLELEELREQSTSVGSFLNAVAAMSDRQDLRDSIK